MSASTATDLSTERPMPDSALLAVPLDRKSIPQERLNIENKVRSNLFSWSGQFSPQLVQALLERHAPPGSVVLDPFMGSATVAVECGRLGLSMVGTEINPAAFTMARTYEMMVRDREHRERAISDVEKRLLDLMGTTDLPLLAGTPSDPNAREDIRRLRRTVRSGSRSILVEALTILLDLKHTRVDAETVFRKWAGLKQTVRDLPYSERDVGLHLCDARRLPLEDNTVDVVLTSPPYINVFNYHQQYRKSAEALDWDLLTVARSEIGANRKFRGNRFLTVIQYCIDMAQALTELRRACRKDARIILVVGRESNVRKTPFFNGAIVADIGTRCAGLTLVGRQERVFRNKFGASIFEDILHFTVSDAVADEDPRIVGIEALRFAEGCAPEESMHDLADALARAEQVEPSPLLVAEAARGGSRAS